MPPGLEVTVYKLIGFPPELIGAVQTTTAVPLALPTVAITAVGFPGAVVVVVGGQRMAARIVRLGPILIMVHVARVPTCIGEERCTTSPRPSTRLVARPHAQRVLSDLIASV